MARLNPWLEDEFGGTKRPISQAAPVARRTIPTSPPPLPTDLSGPQPMSIPPQGPMGRQPAQPAPTRNSGMGPATTSNKTPQPGAPVGQQAPPPQTTFPGWAQVENDLINEQIQRLSRAGGSLTNAMVGGPQGWYDFVKNNPELIAERRARMMEILGQRQGAITAESPEVAAVLNGTLQPRLDRVDLAGLTGQSLEGAARRRFDMRAGGGYESGAIANKAEQAAVQREKTRNSVIQEAMGEVNRRYLDEAQLFGMSVDPQLALADAAQRRQEIDQMYEDQALQGLLRVGGLGAAYAMPNLTWGQVGENPYQGFDWSTWEAPQIDPAGGIHG